MHFEAKLKVRQNLMFLAIIETFIILQTHLGVMQSGVEVFH